MFVIVFLLRIFIYEELINVLLWPTRLLQAYRSQSSAKYSNSQLIIHYIRSEYSIYFVLII